jgi:hypothetical protein
MKVLRLFYAAQSTLNASDKGDLAARTPRGEGAIGELREAVHFLRYELPQLQLTGHQRAFLASVAGMCPDPKCSGECQVGWRRFLIGKDPVHARKLESAGLVNLAVGAGGKWTAAHVTPLGRLILAGGPRESGDWRSRTSGLMRRASTF